MSIKYNNETIAGKYKSQIIPPADTVNSGTIRIATQEEVDAGENNTTAVTPQYLSTKQDKLVAGDNILLDENLIECTVYPDGTTIVQNEDGTLTNVAQKTANGNIKIDWSGTTAEYERDMLNGTIQPDWYCYITDDEQLVSYEGLLLSDLSNLNDIKYVKDNGIKTIQNINECNNMYTTDFVSYGTKAYNQLYNMKHSTFDLSKFTVVGTPTITSDGVASGFSRGNYLKTNSTFNYGNSFEILFKFTYKTSSVHQYLVNTTTEVGIICGIYSGGRIFLALGANNSAFIPETGGKTYLVDGQDYYFSLSYKNGAYILKTSIDGLNWIEEINKPYGTQALPNGKGLNLGTNREGTAFCNCSIDLTQFSITVDGKEVFNGNKTGLDVIKEDNYTIFGNPVISEDGVASGFTSNGYLKFSLDQINKPFRIITKFTTPATPPTDNKAIFSLTTGWSNTYIAQRDNYIKAFFYFTDKTSVSDKNYFAIQNNTTYYLALEFTGDRHNLYLSTDITTLFNEPQLVTEGNVPPIITQITIGNHEQRSYSFPGSIDLNSFKIYVDDELIYQPCLKIPYTKSNTGSKIVNSNYRDRVYDIYEQYHSAPYYTIDTTNKNITMPMGELYGMLENKADKTNVLNKSRISNCLLEVPQKVNLELTDEAVIIKAGSIAIVPNGVGVFEERVINSDLVSGSNTLTGQYFLFSTSAGTTWEGVNILSGSAYPSSPTTGTKYYNTTVNKIERFDGSAWVSFGHSFPLALCTLSSGSVTSIDQVFNGIGYIGATVWCDKDIKALIPNGRNEDGTLNNIEIKTNGVKIAIESVNDNILRRAYILLTENGDLGLRSTSGRYYDPESNYFIVDDVKYTQAIIATKTYQNARTLALDVKQPFHAVDCYDLDTKVSKTGDTMTGTLLLDNADLTVSKSDLPTVHLKNTTFDFTSTTTPSSWTGVGRMLMRDKNNQVASYIQTAHDTNNNLATNYVTQRSIDGVTKTGALSVWVSPTGMDYFSFPRCTTRASTSSTASSSKVAVITQNYKNGTSWYRVWSDGWCEQGGRVTRSTNDMTISLLKTMTDTDYSIIRSEIGAVKNQYDSVIHNITTTSFKVYCGMTTSEKTAIIWEAKGYIA